MEKEHITAQYRLCTNGRAVLLTREMKMLNEELCIGFEGDSEGCTAVIKSGENTYYRPIKEGVASLAKKYVAAGPMMITVVKESELSRRWTCDELYAVRENDSVAVAGNMLEYDKLLADQRAEMDELRVQMQEFRAELEQFRREFDEVYAGTEII